MKKSICTLIFSLTSILIGNEGKIRYEVVVDKCGLAIETPSLAKREIRKLRLENGLEALLISDPNTHESGAAVAVGVGSWDDPVERPGMAHFVEHLLFLGTEKYPEEAEYTRYLDENGGERNAFTMADRTVYMFSVNNDGFSGALDRFGQFFISPLFNPSGVERECKAIHQEFCKDLPLDPWRILYVKKELANKSHPFHSFCIGNQETLAKISQDELKAWYGEHYSANLMHLVVYSSLDLESLEKEVTQLFSKVKNKNKLSSHWTTSLLKESEQPKLCAITPVQELQLLELSWEIPRFYGQDKELHAEKLLSHVLGHEGSTSLLAQLKREGLAEALAVGNHRAGNDQCFISLSVDLTAEGIEKHATVIQRCFEALATLKVSGIPRYIFDEVCQIEKLHYQYQSRPAIFSLVSEYAMGMLDEPLETFPQKTLIPSVYEPSKLNELITYLTPQRCQYTLVAPPRLTHLEPQHKEKWMGVDYTVVDIATDDLERWTKASVNSAISIPRPNPYLPSDLVIKGEAVEREGILPIPVCIADEPLGKIYTASDTEFLIPEICWLLTIKTPLISDANPLSQVYADLFCQTLDENLKASSYEALMGGLKYTLTPKHGAFELKITGYSDKALPFLQTLVEAMKTSCPTEEHFNQYRKSLARDYTNELNANPLKQGSELLWSVLFKDFSGLKPKGEALEVATFDQCKAFCEQALDTCYIEGMFYGNLKTQEGEQAWEMIKKTLHFKPYPIEDHPKIALAHLPENDSPAFLLLKSPSPANAVILATDCGAFTFKRRAAQEILTKGLEEPFFSELRTRQQTAYLVTNWSQELERHLYSFFAIQSSSHDTRDLLARFELFIESSLQNMKDEVLPEERFESIRTAYMHQLQHPAENLQKMGGLLHTIAFQYDGDFSWMEKRLKAFKDLTYAEFLEYAQSFLGKDNVRRLAICVNGATDKKGNLFYRHVTTPEKLRSEICYEGRDLLATHQ